MSDTKTPAAQQYAMVLELAKNMMHQNHLLERIADGIEELLSLFGASLPAETTTPAPASSAGSPSSSSTPAAAPSGMEGMFEQMIAAHLGVPLEDLRAGKIDQVVMKRAMEEAMAKKNGAAPATPT